MLFIMPFLCFKFKIKVGITLQTTNKVRDPRRCNCKSFTLKTKKNWHVDKSKIRRKIIIDETILGHKSAFHLPTLSHARVRVGACVRVCWGGVGKAHLCMHVCVKIVVFQTVCSTMNRATGKRKDTGETEFCGVIYFCPCCMVIKI
jgi:hypothetical protein